MTFLRAFRILLAAGVLAAAPIQAAPLDDVDQKMLDLGAQMQNARMRLTKAFAGVGTPGDEGASVTELCCRENITTMYEKLKSLNDYMDRMEFFYSDRQNGTAMAMLRQMKPRLELLVEGTVYFARAQSEEQALMTLNGMIKPWNEFRNGLRTLTRCCPLTELPELEPAEEGAEGAPDDTGKEKKGKKGKKKSES